MTTVSVTTGAGGAMGSAGALALAASVAVVWLTDVVTIAESREKGDKPSRPPLAESFSTSDGRFVRTYPFNLNLRPNGVSVRN